MTRDRWIGIHYKSISCQIVILVIVPWIVYALSIPGAFVYDDVALTVLDNPLLRGEVSILEAMTWDRPLRELTYLLDCALWGFNPIGYHIQNVMWHTANGLLIFWLVRLLGIKNGAPFFIALLFATHPINTESGRMDIGAEGVVVPLFRTSCVWFVCPGGYAFGLESVKTPAGLPWLALRLFVGVFIETSRHFAPISIDGVLLVVCGEPV